MFKSKAPSEFDAPDNYDGDLWEYRCRNLAKVADAMMERDFNDHGNQGWELVCFVAAGREGYAVFKRRRAAATTAAAAA